jgi:trans-2,3-dihydro-3-hydroxyanthranilate isomerase
VSTGHRPADLRLSWLDVFTDRPLSGNPLAVVHDADALGAHRMQALTRELGLSETVFVLDEASALRIFTPGKEVPLAGHPVVGAALELARIGRIPARGRAVFRTGAGETPVELADGVAMMTQAEPRLGPELEPARMAALLGLDPPHVVGTPAVCSTGLEVAFVQVPGRRALAEVVPNQEEIGALDVEGVAAWCEDEPGGLTQRFFAPRLGIGEDPATGSAAGALGALRVLRGADPGALVVCQGEEVGRPSTIRVEVGGAPGRPEAPRVGGSAVLVLEATVRQVAVAG